MAKKTPTKTNKEAEAKAKRAKKYRQKKARKELSENARRVLTIALAAVCSALILAFSSLTVITATQGSYQDAPNYLMWVFISMGLLGFIPFIKKSNKINLIKALVQFIFSLALGIMVLFAKDNIYMFSLTGGLFAVAFIATRALKVVEDHSVRSCVFNGILITIALGLGIALFIPVDVVSIDQVILLECMFIAFIALGELAFTAFANFRFTVLFRIIVKTFALEILFGLFATMVASALILLTIEDAFTTFGDSLWYCFAVVTTIGFGDFVADTIIGRLITVVLGTYGIVAVAVITSIIVNFYNEVSGKKDKNELKKIEKEEAKDK